MYYEKDDSKINETKAVFNESTASYVKNYNVGQIQIDLPKPNYFYTLPLFIFGDIYGTVELSIVFNYAMKAQNNNPFYMSAGYKLNLQKRIVFEFGTVVSYQESSGKITKLNRSDANYTFDDDTQRILRRLGSVYELEYSNGSKETYDGGGKITKSVNKYNTEVLSYNYNNAGKLTAITYRQKSITINYDQINRISSVSYGGKTIDFTYTEQGIKVNSYDGITVTLASNGMDFSATAQGTEHNTTVTYATEITKSASNDDTLIIANRIGNKYINTEKYRFPQGLVAEDLDYNKNYPQIDITNDKYVTTRIQFDKDKPCYSYEVNNVLQNDGEYVPFINEGSRKTYAGTVSVLNNNDVSALQTYDTAYKMELFDDSTNSWRKLFTGTEDLYGTFMVSGWIKTGGVSECEITVTDIFNGKTITIQTIKNLALGKWNFFAINCYIANPSEIIAKMNYNSNSMQTRDFRITFVNGNTYTNKFSLIRTDTNVLVKETTGGNEIINIANVKGFCINGNIVNANITLSDLQKYKVNQLKNKHTNEVYYDNCRGIMYRNGAFQLEYTDANGQTALINVDDVDIGTLSKRNDKSYLTKYSVYEDADGESYYICKSYENDTLRQTVKYDKWLDVVQSTVDGVETVYERTNGLLTKETVTGLYTKTMAYSEDADGNPTVSLTDEYNNVTVCTIDKVWGVQKSVTLTSGTVVTDEYDDDMCSLLKRNFDANGPSISYIYTDGNLTALQSGVLNYEFGYTDGDIKTVKKCNTDVEEHEITNNFTRSYYPSKTGKLFQNFTNYDKYGRVTEVVDELKFTYDLSPAFNNAGVLLPKANNGSAVLATSKDLLNNEETHYIYENSQLSNVKVYNASNVKVSEETFAYDEKGRVTTNVCVYDTADNKSVGGSYTYKVDESVPSTDDNRVYSFTYNVKGAQKVYGYNTYDQYKRLAGKNIKFTETELYFRKSYTYDKTRVQSINDKFETVSLATQNYGYDCMGRINSNNYTVSYQNRNNSYVYDNIGRLVRENNLALNKTFVYDYDNSGNLYNVKTYAYTTAQSPTGNYTQKQYTYSSTYRDTLTTFNGTYITYDACGYPVKYGEKAFVWNKGRLVRMYDDIDENSADSSDDVRFTYNAYGQRTSKVYDNNPGPDYSGDITLSEKRTYDYDNSGRLIHEVITVGYSISATDVYELTYLYDETGMIGFNYNYPNANVNKNYYYHRNLQGDVIAIYDVNRELIAEYLYDAWGNCQVVRAQDNNIAYLNPIRYRGYYYDVETQLFYCNSRYYSPELCRWISPDSIEYLDPQSINGLNLYAYCGNDPVNRFDPTGHAFISVLVGLGIAALIGAGIGAASYTAGQLIDYAITGDFEWSWGGFIGSTVGGAIGGAITFATAGIGGAFATMAGAFLSGAAMTSSTMIGENIAGDANHSLGDILISSLISGGISMASVGIMSKIKIPSLNSGRGSMSAVSKQMYTKFQRQIIKRVSMRTFTKMLAVEAYNGAAGNIMEWAYGISGAKDYVLNFF